MEQGRQLSLASVHTFRFDQIAYNITERVEPADAAADIYVGLEHLDPNSLRLRRWGTPADVEGTKLRFYPGDIIFGRRRAYQRKLAVAEFEGICSAHAMVLRARPDVCLPEFLPFFLQSDRFFNRAMAISVGSLSPTINWKTLAMQEFVLPPLEEQRRIAEAMLAVESQMEALSDARARLSTVRSAIEKFRFVGSGGCSATTLGDLIRQGTISLQTGPFGTVLKASSYTDPGIPNVARHGISVRMIAS
jgi:type I restriction enzyme, S subunit